MIEKDPKVFEFTCEHSRDVAADLCKEATAEYADVLIWLLSKYTTCLTKNCEQPAACHRKTCHVVAPDASFVERVAFYYAFPSGCEQ